MTATWPPRRYGLGQTYEILGMTYYALFYYRKATALRPYDARMWCAMAVRHPGVAGRRGGKEWGGVLGLVCWGWTGGTGCGFQSMLTMMTMLTMRCCALLCFTLFKILTLFTTLLNLLYLPYLPY